LVHDNKISPLSLSRWRLSPLLRCCQKPTKRIHLNNGIARNRTCNMYSEPRSTETAWTKIYQINIVDYRQSVVALVTSCCALPVLILPLEAATSTLSVTTSRSYKDISTGVHFMSPGLLQLSAVRSDRQTHAASTVGAECCCKADHRSETSRTHHTDIVSTSFVAGQTTSWIQDG